ncbi:MAG: thioredoxin-disulfide reductase [Pleurocapsa minor GSE-CHR-MK-17-07R]|jgi:thioredoxin reductase (NADPH)|nr:thioredoxin-disulfide reductase [Pleurocapsa minor GSE-CHR-MK 17-07R]
MRKVRVLIIGSGPSGLTAALYSARAQLSTVVITGMQFGGQIATTHDVDNFPGFPDGVQGPDLTDKMRLQAERFGAEMVYDIVTEIDFAGGSPFRVKTQNEEFLADSVIVTIGASPRRLNVPGENEFIGRGVSWCATCDGFFFRGKDILVVGGGDSALQEAIFLTKFASTVTIVHRRDELRASVALQSRALNHEKIRFIYDTVIDEIKGENGLVKGAVLRNLKTGAVEEKPTDGVFIFIGYTPNSAVFNGQLKTDPAGYVIVDNRMATNIDGVFAGGEIHDDVFRQAITASGQGAAAALMAVNWIGEREGLGLLQPIEEPATVPAGS